MVPLSMLQFYNILHLQNILRIPYIRNIPWLFHVSNILLLISSFYVKGILFFFSFSFITSWNIIFFFVPLLFQIDFVKGPSLIPCVSCYFYITMPRANGIFLNILEFRIHLLKKNSSHLEFLFSVLNKMKYILLENFLKFPLRIF